VIHKEWIKKWKLFSKTKQLKRNYNVTYQIEDLEKEYPGPITNEKLLKDFSKYLRDDNENDQANFAIKKKTREGVEYKLVPGKCWKILKDRFGGLELKRFKDPDMYNRKYTIKFSEVTSCILTINL
jgi:hypothetical protein